MAPEDRRQGRAETPGCRSRRHRQTGLDEHQVRTWTLWYRWTTLVLLAHLFLVATTTAERASPASVGLIPLTLNEVRHLFVRLVVPLAVHLSDCL